MHLIGIAFLIFVGIFLLRKFLQNAMIEETGTEYETGKRRKSDFIEGEIIDVEPIDEDEPGGPHAPNSQQ